MALSKAQFRERIENAKRNADIKAVIESTGAQPTSSNPIKGEYMYHAPYREDADPSLKINILLQKFIDFGMDGSEGDVIELIRRIVGKGDINAMPFLKAVEWLERFSGGSVLPQAIQSPTRSKSRPVATSHEGERFSFVRAVPVSNKTHPNNLDYITKKRLISLPVASRHLNVITYKDYAAATDDPLRGQRFGIGGQNDAGGWEVRAPTVNSNFKISLGPKDITTLNGKPDATTGHIFEGRFDFLTYLEMTRAIQPEHPTVILNSGRMAARAVDVIKSRSDWQHITNWHIWQHNDDEGRRTTEVIADGLVAIDHTVGTMEYVYQGYKDLNECWINTPEAERPALAELFRKSQPINKAYDTSATTEHRRFIDSQRKNPPKLF